MLARPDNLLKRTDFAGLKAWPQDDHLEAFQAFRNSAARSLEKPYRKGLLGGDPAMFEKIATKAVAANIGTGAEAREFFEVNFQPYRISAEGFLTGYFEPQVEASPVETNIFRYPLYRRPDDLIDIDDENRPEDMDPQMRFGRNGPHGPEPYADRAAIEAGALAGRGLELVWLKDRVDCFFIHVQGAAKLSMRDGTVRRVTFDAKSGHRYVSLGKTLCNWLDAGPEDMTADRLAAWMRDHPERLDELLAHNPSYIFFREVDGQRDAEGPIAAAKVPLTAGRSLAVDRLLHSYGSPIWLGTIEALPGETGNLARLMIAQDTGSAITGPARGDIFIGSGAQAGEVAGRVRHACEMVLLLPRRA